MKDNFLEELKNKHFNYMKASSVLSSRNMLEKFYNCIEELIDYKVEKRILEEKEKLIGIRKDDER